MYGVYVHVPWCRIHCPYCAFVVDTRRVRPHAAFVDAILRDFERQASWFDGPPETLYLGGGTPSLLPVDEVARLVQTIGARGEVTIEVNPRTADLPRLRALAAAGVDRVSLGVQSFQPAVARRLGRGHGVADNRRLVDDSGAAGFRSRSVDLIYGVPGQTVADWARDLAEVVASGVDHVSLYGLTIEAGTPFARAGVEPADDELWRELHGLAVTTLGDAGLGRYEASNFARPGHRSVHNEHYWRARSWMGLGPGAHGWWPDGRRTEALSDVDGWMAADNPLVTVERPERDALAYELVWSTLRHVDGLDLALLRRWTGLVPDLADRVFTDGLAVHVDGVVRLGAEGWYVADAVASRIHRQLTPGLAELQTVTEAVR